jgi:hypothetical protein
VFRGSGTPCLDLAGNSTCDASDEDDDEDEDEDGGL